MTGLDLHNLVARLYAIRGRSITGPGLRATLGMIGENMGETGDWQVHAVPSGTRLFDWAVPDEWALRRATCRLGDGTLLADSDALDLHAINYGRPLQVSGRLRSLGEFIRSLPDRPADVPYVTSYYTPAAGVCLTHRERELWADADATIEVDATLGPGVLNYGELTIPGDSDDVVLLSAHCCHPQLANDNLASIACLVGLARHLAARRRHFTYRLVFAPGTIGALAWLAANEAETGRITAGLVVACAGDAGPLTYKRSRRGGMASDWIMGEICRNTRPFTPWDYDERQYNSPAFDLPVGRLTRTPNGEYPQYHTSADDMSLVREDALADTLAALTRWAEKLEEHQPAPPPATFGRGDGPIRADGRGEPQLGRHGLYDDPDMRPAILWALNLADGRHTPRQTADRASLDVAAIERALAMCRDRGLIM